MAKEREFENILNECLDRLIKGETIESCLARYPVYAAELEPLLKTALEARLAATLQPRPEFRNRAANEFQAAVRNLPSKQPRGAFRWQLRWVLPVAVILVILVGGAGTATAATNALPDSPLYGVKMAVESVQVAFTFSQQGKAELYARFVDYRVEEIVSMAEAGNSYEVEQATERMNGQLIAMADLKFNDVTKGQEAGIFNLMGAAGGAATPPSVTTAAPTTTTQSVAVPAPTTTTPATTVPAPPIIVTQPPSQNETRLMTIQPPAAIPQAPGMEAATGAATDTGGLTDIEKFKLLLFEKLEKNLQILRDEWEKASEALKPALQKAIEVAEAGYQQIIANLG